MRSFIIIEVEHGDSTDELEQFIADALAEANWSDVEVEDYSVRIDLPPYITAKSLTVLGLPTHSEGQ